MNKKLIVCEDLTPSYAQAIRIRKLSEKHKLTFDTLEKILDEKKVIKMIEYLLTKKR